MALTATSLQVPTMNLQLAFVSGGIAGGGHFLHVLGHCSATDIVELLLSAGDASPPAANGLLNLPGSDAIPAAHPGRESPQAPTRAAASARPAEAMRGQSAFDIALGEAQLLIELRYIWMPAVDP